MGLRNAPAPQLLHTVDTVEPEVEPYFPATQLMQALEPAADWYVPAAHDAQELDEVAPEEPYLPAEHIPEQIVAPEAAEKYLRKKKLNSGKMQYLILKLKNVKIWKNK